MTDYTLRMNRVPPPFRKTVTLVADAVAPVLNLLAGNDNFSVIKSTDGGVTWGSQVTIFTTGFGSIVGLAKLTNGNIFALSSEGLGAISTDGGATWTELTTPPVAPGFPGGVSGFGNGSPVLAYDGVDTLCFALHNNSNGKESIIASSSNGADGSWSTVYGPSATAIGNVFGIARNSTAFVGYAQTNVILRSTDGLTWSEIGAIGGVTFANVAIPVGSGFAAMGGDGSINPLASFSADGSSWSAATAMTGLGGLRGDGFQYKDGVYSGQFFDSGSFLRSIWVSSNGIAWTHAYDYLLNGSPMTAAVIGNAFLVGAIYNDNTSALLSSTDGTTWGVVSAFPGIDAIENYINVIIGLN